MSRLVLLALLLAAPAGASAQPPEHAMHRQMHDYFDGELRESWVFLSTGAATTGSGIALAIAADDMGDGAAIPLIGIGVVQLGAGIVVQARTRGQIRERHARIAGDPLGYQEDELARMRGVDRDLDRLMVLELALAAAGAGTALTGWLVERDFVLGLGLGFAAQSLAMLVLDLFVARRADRYTVDLQSFSVALRADPQSAAIHFAMAL